jgi:hypothetical protein
MIAASLFRSISRSLRHLDRCSAYTMASLYAASYHASVLFSLKPRHNSRWLFLFVIFITATAQPAVMLHTPLSVQVMRAATVFLPSSMLRRFQAISRQLRCWLCWRPFASRCRAGYAAALSLRAITRLRFIISAKRLMSVLRCYGSGVFVFQQRLINTLPPPHGAA